jgi:hypothetical protein
MQRTEPDSNDVVWIEYYQPPCKNIPRTENAKLRHQFATFSSRRLLVACKPRLRISGRAIVSAYLASVEKKMERTISRQSIAYWLHVYRRIAFYPKGELCMD